MHRFQDKVVIVTGGTSGIGLAASQAFAGEGARVVIAARGADQGESVAAEIRASGGSALFVQADMAKPQDIESLIKRTVETFGRIDCAFNNAASLDGVFKPLAEFTEEEYDSSMSANLKGVWLCMKYEIEQMLRQQPAGGVIVNTSSGNGLGGSPGGSLYSAAKAGVIALTKSAAQEYIKQGIRINVLVPGAYETPMLHGAKEHYFGATPEGIEAANNKWNQMIPAGRIGDPKEAAAAALWLCSDESSYVVGHSLIVDGGITAAWR